MTEREYAEQITRLRRRVRRLEHRQRVLLSAINWVCGCGPSNFDVMALKADGRFWWRKYLPLLAGLEWSTNKARYVLPRGKG